MSPTIFGSRSPSRVLAGPSSPPWMTSEMLSSPHLAISPEWMLTDTEENEIRPANPGQIQPASMQQFLRRRTVPQGHSESTYIRSAEASADEQTSRQSTFNKPTQVKPSVADLKISGPTEMARRHI